MALKGEYFKSHGIDGGFFTAKIDVYEGRDIIVIGVPNTLVQTNMTPIENCEERVIMKITGFWF